MPSSPIFSRKVPISRNGLRQERGYSRSLPWTRIRVLYALIAILLAVVLLLSHRQLARTSEGSPPSVIGYGAAEDTLRSLLVFPASTRVVQVGAGQFRVGNGDKEPLHTTEISNEATRPKVLAFVGIQTGFGSAERRRALRQTWFPSTNDGIMRLERDTGLAFRFVIGHSSDAKQIAELDKEIEAYRDFMRIDHEEDYARLPFKTLAFFKAAHMLYDAEFYVKADDDIYLRPDRLSIRLKRKWDSSRTYLGCMKKGSVITNNAFKWYEPLGYLLGNEYFYHAYGPIYALSRDVVADLSNFKNDSLRMFSNEDVTIGSWMLAFNVHHEDDRSLCQAECRDDSIAVWDIPQCSGLCHPETKLLELHQRDICSKSPALPDQ